MCGIAGIVRSGGLTEADGLIQQSMLGALRHRGPDGNGYYATDRVTIGNTRLSIIDVAGGWQPIFSEDRAVVLVANGEIYNNLEVRNQLIQLGHRFQGGSDCEVILHLYEEHGKACVDYLRGMFAFALWDEREKRLLLGRDRMGEKPLYYFEMEGGIVFASELRAITASIDRRWALDPAALDDFFRHQYIEEPFTAISGIRKLRAGSILEVDTAKWRVTEKRYWRMEDAPPIAGDPATLLRREFEQACELSLQSDVPVGVALSGGIDSTALATVASTRRGSKTLQAFTVGYRGRPSTDERWRASATAKRLGMPFREVEIGVDEVADAFPSMVVRRGDPIADITGSAYQALFRLSAESGVRVLLMGQGGDELFWGYDWVRSAVEEGVDRRERLAGGWPFKMKHLGSLLPRGMAPGDLWRYMVQGLGVVEVMKRYRRLATCAKPPAFYEVVASYAGTLREIRSAYTPQFQGSIDDTQKNDGCLCDGRVDILITRRICETYLRENGLAQADRLGMAQSVEVRVPFVDYRFVELVIGLRKSFPDHRFRPKEMLLKAIGDIVPADVATRKKQGFTPPIRAWHNAIFRRHGKNLKGGMLVQMGVLRPEAAVQLARGEFPRGRGVPLCMKALVLECWIRGTLGDQGGVIGATE